MTPTHEQSIDTLNTFLRGEISAVETYRQALEKVELSPTRTQLEECHASHAQRIQVLTDQILTLGGQPAKGSGAWGTFAKLIEGGAKMFGRRAAIAALEEGEDHGHNDYRREMDKLDVESRQIIQAQVIPEQLKTHDMLSDLRKALEN